MSLDVRPENGATASERQRRDLLELRALEKAEREELAFPDEARRPKALEAGPPERIGVVFVHGVGSQAQSSTVREFGEPLLDRLREWHRARDLPFRMIWSRLSYGAKTEEPARFSLLIPECVDDAGHARRRQIWILQEAWWAARLEAPPLPVIALWTLRIFGRTVWRLWLGFLGRIEAPPGGVLAVRPWWAQLFERTGAVLLLMGTVVGGIVGIVILLAVLLVAQLPLLGAVERFILFRALRSLLVDNIGDFYVFLHDEIQALHVRRGVAEAISWLLRRGGCERVLVMGHSQGTVVALDALASEDVDPADRARVTTLVTVGSALNNAWAEEDTEVDGVAARPIPRALPQDPGRTAPLGWLNVWSEYDPVSGGPFDLDPDPAEELRVTNELSVLTDHGGYVRNPEAFLARLAQEIESPGMPAASRFYPGAAQEMARLERREVRVGALVGLRLAAAIAAAAAVVVRYGSGAVSAARDGDVLWTALGAVPLLGGAVAGPAGFATNLAAAPAFIAGQVELRAQPASDAVVSAVQAARAVLTTGGLTGVSVATVTALFVLVYVAGVTIFYSGWHRIEGLRSAWPDPELQAPALVWARVTAVVALLAACSWVVIALPPLEEIRELISRATAGS